jgi:serine protease Do
MTNSFRKRLAYGFALIGSAAAVAAAPFALSAAEQQANNSKSTTLNLKVDSGPVNRSAVQTNSFAPVVDKVTPSVVMISVTGRGDEQQLSDLDQLRRFFGDGPLGGPSSPFGGRPPRQRGLGSGVIVSPDGYILTNNHVVDHADTIDVSLTDGRKFSGKVVGTDPPTDVALVKIEANDLPALTMADSDQVKVGDVVLAIGNPFGIGQTVTSGIVSAKNRGGVGEGYEDFIQTDAAINPGNSGGALVDSEGRLIGVNTAILSRTGGNQGIGFAVPSNLARWVMSSLATDGKVERGFLGVTIQDLTPELAQALRLSRNSGALVADVQPNSPAGKAGFQSGDVILQFNGKPVENASELRFRVAETRPGSAVPVEVDRNGQTNTLNVTLQEQPSRQLTSARPSGEQNSDALSGVGVADLDSQVRAQLKVPASLHGAVITEVDQNSAAYDAGLRPGDVILEINRKPVKNAEDAVSLTQNPSSRQTLVKVWSNNNTRFVVVDEANAG